jgi:hypothetical protein
MLHLREPPHEVYPVPIITDEKLLGGDVPHRENRLRHSTYRLYLWKGMSVVMMDKHAKGMQGDIRDVYEIYPPSSLDSRTNCLPIAQTSHCEFKTKRCQLIYDMEQTDQRCSKKAQSTRIRAASTTASK